MKTRRRRCLCCQKLFGRDPRLRHRQKYCSEPECRAASKRSSQRRWLRKPENQEYFCGEQHVDRVQHWRAKNPGYWRKPPVIGEPLQEMILAQPDDPVGKSGCANNISCNGSPITGGFRQYPGFFARQCWTRSTCCSPQTFSRLS